MIRRERWKAIIGTFWEFTITPEPHYHILDITLDGESIPGDVDIYENGTGTFLLTVTGDHEINALFEIDSYIITASAGENGSIDPEGETEVTYNTDAAFLITADEGYHISRLRIDDLYNINDAAGFPEYTYTFEAVANDHTIEATFAVNSYYISAIISPEGTGQVLGGGYYDHGSEVRLEANPWPGYRFDHWKEGDEVITGEDGAPAGAVYEFIATAGRELTAFFKEMDYVVTFTVVKENESPVTGATITVSQGTDEVAVITTGSDGKASIPLVPGSYDYAVTAEEFEDDSGNFNLSDMDLEITVTMLHTGITGVSPPNGRIMVYPNPGDGLFHVEYEGTEGTGLKTEVMSVTGNLVYVGEFHGTGNLRETIDLRHVSRGVYFLRVNDNGRISTLKLIFR